MKPICDEGPIEFLSSYELYSPLIICSIVVLPVGFCIGGDCLENVYGVSTLLTELSRSSTSVSYFSYLLLITP